MHKFDITWQDRKRITVHLHYMSTETHQHFNSNPREKPLSSEPLSLIPVEELLSY